jgi:hypothetical protein
MAPKGGRDCKANFIAKFQSSHQARRKTYFADMSVTLNFE